MNVMMIGSATELPKAPTEKTKFIEDMTDDQVANMSLVPTGLQNLGYIN